MSESMRDAGGACLNCGGSIGAFDEDDCIDPNYRCLDCGWPEGKPVPPFPLCSMCRRRHAPEVKHAGDE